MKHSRPRQTDCQRPICVSIALTTILFVAAASAQGPVAAPATPPETHHLPAPSCDAAAMDPTIDPCNDFYKFACGKYAANNPIPADQTGADQFHSIYNLDDQELNESLKAYAATYFNRTPNQQKIGDYHAACMNLDLIEKNGLTPLQPALDRIDKVTLFGLSYLTGELQRDGVDVFFGLSKTQQPGVKT